MLASLNSECLPASVVVVFVFMCQNLRRKQKDGVFLCFSFLLTSLQNIQHSSSSCKPRNSIHCHISYKQLPKQCNRYLYSLVVFTILVSLKSSYVDILASLFASVVHLSTTSHIIIVIPGMQVHCSIEYYRISRAPICWVLSRLSQSQ